MESGAPPHLPDLQLLSAPAWQDYELLDSGGGLKLERYGSHRFIRPEPEAVWCKALPEKEWKTVDAVFKPSAEEMGGHWESDHHLQPRWVMQYNGMKFWAQISNSRHLGVFPEQASQWDWIQAQVRAAGRQPHLLNLFGYTGLATLAGVQAGARVTHVDASRKVVSWARENIQLNHFGEDRARWIVDDALKFVQREGRRGARYDGIILDPPKFGRGPKGEVWDFYRWIPALLDACRQVLAPQPLFVVLTAYAVKASAVTLYQAVDEMMSGRRGSTSAGELTLLEKSAGRVLSLAIFARWSSLESKNGGK